MTVFVSLDNLCSVLLVHHYGSHSRGRTPFLLPSTRASCGSRVKSSANCNTAESRFYCCRSMGKGVSKWQIDAFSRPHISNFNCPRVTTSHHFKLAPSNILTLISCPTAPLVQIQTLQRTKCCSTRLLMCFVLYNFQMETTIRSPMTKSCPKQHMPPLMHMRGVPVIRRNHTGTT